MCILNKCRDFIFPMCTQCFPLFSPSSPVPWNYQSYVHVLLLGVAGVRSGSSKVCDGALQPTGHRAARGLTVLLAGLAGLCTKPGET